METIAFVTEPVPPYGVVQTMHALVRRLVVRNPGPFTYHGTNTWIVGTGRVAVIDPGPDDPAHRRALLDAIAGETVTHILVTHSHQDHAPGAAPYCSIQFLLKSNCLASSRPRGFSRNLLRQSGHRSKRNCS